MSENKKLLIKALVWRFFIAIQFGMAVTYAYLEDIKVVTELTIVINIMSTVLYYTYDVVWNKINNLKRLKDDTITN